MANRVLLGNRAGTYGLWVSKPGIDVLTASTSNLLFSSQTSKTVRVLASGSLFFPSGGTNSLSIAYGLTAPNRAAPLVLTSSAGSVNFIQPSEGITVTNLTSTGATVNRLENFNSIDITAFWLLLTEIGN